DRGPVGDVGERCFWRGDELVDHPSVNYGTRLFSALFSQSALNSMYKPLKKKIVRIEFSSTRNCRKSLSRQQNHA
ncbi:MAG TPA: hypothetical protein VFX94_08320, partial [Burkholderiales bacterium]|nr:hypothetical protein [Burkholderiales bacterium]